MAGAGLDVELDEQEIQAIIDALRRASTAKLLKIAQFAGEKLLAISEKAFEQEQNPATGEKWQDLKKPRGKRARSPGSTAPILTDYGQLKRSLIYEAFSDGSVLFGTNMVYSRIHQKGGKAGRGHRATIPARPFLGVPDGFDRKILADPVIQRLLGL